MKLPALVLFADHGNDWNVYIDAIYAHFQDDFVHSRPIFRGTVLGLKKYPEVDGREGTFWHLISQGPVEPARIQYVPRCERIKWPSPIINDCDTYPTHVRVWENTRRNKSGSLETRICLAFGNWEYLVVLVKRTRPDGSKYILPWTAYPLDRKHTMQKLEKEYKVFHGIA